MILKDPHSIQIKQYNRSRILQMLHDKKVTRTDLAGFINLTPASISILVQEMIYEGIIIDTKEAVPTKTAGRKKTFLRVNKNFYYLIGVGIESDSITITLSNLYKDVLDTVTYPIVDHNQMSMIDTIVANCLQLCQQHNIPKSKWLGVGVGIVGIVDSKRGISEHAYGIWNSPVHLKDLLEARLGVEVVVDNNVHALALAEAETRDHNKDLAFIKFGPGIGAALILDFEIYSGNTYNALEFGHTIVNAFGDACKCGQRGCLETVSSFQTIVKHIEDVQDRTVLANQPLTATSIIWANKQHDPLIAQILQESFHYFAVGLINLIKTVDTKEIILYGPMFQDDLMLQTLRQTVTAMGSDCAMRIKQSIVSTNKAIGAVSIARKRLFYNTGGQKKGVSS